MLSKLRKKKWARAKLMVHEKIQPTGPRAGSSEFVAESAIKITAVCGL